MSLSIKLSELTDDILENEWDRLPMIKNKNSHHWDWKCSVCGGRVFTWYPKIETHKNIQVCSECNLVHKF